MLEEELRAALHYGSHSFASKEVEFFHQEIPEQVQAGHIVVSPLASPRPTKIVAIVSGHHPTGGADTSPHFIFRLERPKQGHFTRRPWGVDVF